MNEPIPDVLSQSPQGGGWFNLPAVVLVLLVALLLIRSPVMDRRTEKRGMVEEMKEGFRFVAHRPTLQLLTFLAFAGSRSATTYRSPSLSPTSAIDLPSGASIRSFCVPTGLFAMTWTLCPFLTVRRKRSASCTLDSWSSIGWSRRSSQACSME